jgi:hypothetical protein
MWEEDDELKDLFLATFGSYPSKEEIEIDYRLLFDRLSPQKIELKPGAVVPAAPYEMLSPMVVTSMDLSAKRLSIAHREPGFYVGSANDVTDLINFWNLRAASIELFFYDPNFHERLKEPFEKHKVWLQSRPKRDPVWPFHSSIWTKTRQPHPDRQLFGEGFITSVIDANLWHRNVVWKPAPVTFEEQSLLATVSQQYERSTVTFQLPEKPCSSHFSFHEQKLVVSLRPLLQNSSFILSPPYTPKLNDFTVVRFTTIPGRCGPNQTVSESSSMLTDPTSRCARWTLPSFWSESFCRMASKPHRVMRERLEVA